MSAWKRVAIPLVAIVAWLVMGLILSHIAFVLMTRQYKMIDRPSYMLDVYESFERKGAAQPREIRGAALAGFGLGALAALLVWYVLAMDRRSVYGKARFATAAEVRKAGFLERTSNSLVVGRYRGKYLYYAGQQFALLAAPTRSGKGVGIVIPNLLSYGESIVVLDIKQENFKLTSGFRAKHDHKVYLFNPFAEDGRTHRWNPLTYISLDKRARVSDVMSIALMLYPVHPDGRDQFWKNQAQNVFVALVLYLLELRDCQSDLDCPPDLLTPVSIGAVVKLATSDGISLREHLQTLSQDYFLGVEARTAFGGLLGNNDEVFASVMATFKEPLLPWLNPVVDAATSADDFSLADVRKKKMTIYIGILPNKLADAKLIVSLFFSQLINENTRQLPQENPELKYQCVLMMDEFTSLGRVEILAKALSYIAGYNLRLVPIVQSVAQLDATYGKEDSRTMITNHALQILFTPRAQSDANEYSEMLGFESVDKTTRTVGKASAQNSRSISAEKRALMLPQELKAMSTDKQIIVYEGMRSPIMCEKIRYYEDKNFTDRILAPVSVPRLQY